ncbi:hypothetical protein ACFQ0K_08975 [Nocardioides caeni]|uniref:hypothetical protein n=1 Tax=Nocardioides caeni TaxID=574700 RepID=UPI001930EE2B|nr:hypothetical protein [Nocardioides caeni]
MRRLPDPAGSARGDTDDGRSCNASKCNDEVTAWMRRKRLDERAFLQRFGEVVAALRLDPPA